MKGLAGNLTALTATALVAAVFCFDLMPDVVGAFTGLAERPAAAFLTALGLFALKCLAPIIPMGIIYMLCGYMFSPWAALSVCTAGNAICFACSYCEGLASDAESLPIVSAISESCKGGFFPSFFLHCIRFFPCHTAGVYLGAARLPFFEYLLGSLLGALPTVLLSLSLSTAFTFPTPRIWIGLAAVAATTVTGLIFLKCQNK